MNNNDKEFYKVTINFQNNNIIKITSITKIQSINKPSNEIVHKTNYDLWINYFNNRAELINYIEYIYCPIIVKNQQTVDDILSLLPFID